MARTSALEAAVVLVLASIVGLGSVLFAIEPAQAATCSPDQIRLGTCHVDGSVGGDHVTLTGSGQTPGGGGSTSPGASGGSGANSGGGSSGGGGSNGNGTSGSGGGSGSGFTCTTFVAKRCLVRVPHTTPGPSGSPGATTPPVRPITFRDIASFRPVPGIQRMEPNGWIVPGLDANFYSIVGQQLVPGTLLGQPATVRFTPVAWHWSYGDGSSAVRPTKGGTWAAQGLHEFDPTPTSHVYAVEGEYVIHLSIDFRAEYRFGSRGFVPIAGRITLPANDLRITVTGAKTVLVDKDCAANPAGPGC